MNNEVRMVYNHYLKVKLTGHKYALQHVGWYIWMKPERYLRFGKFETENEKIRFELFRAAGIRYTGTKKWWEFWL